MILINKYTIIVNKLFLIQHKYTNLYLFCDTFLSVYQVFHEIVINAKKQPNTLI